MQLPKQPLMLYVNDKIYLPNPAEPGAFVPASPEAAAALDAKDAEIARLRAALERVMVGGNHLAVWLPEPCPPIETEPLVALEQIGSGIHYDVWCGWRAIMQSRAALSATTKE
jgi:hypothetical protein